MNAVLMARLTIAPAAAARVGQEGKPGIRLWSDMTRAKVADAHLVRPDGCAVIAFGFINHFTRNSRTIVSLLAYCFEGNCPGS
jgi:hypothetical protein